ncbi:MAG: 4Fe-4S binding protein [Bacteroidota bacterium]|nr:4Fe-4S binding protein [Bacteroidota bacterium]
MSDTFEVSGISFAKKKRTIKKIPPHMRRRKINFSLEPRWYKRLLWKLREDSQFLRSAVQLAFVLLCLWIGIDFYLFVAWGTSGGIEGVAHHPPGAEGFLPISALMSLKYWLQTGIINDIHPAGLFILIAILAIGLLLKKAFCSWPCPIGTLSESLWMLGERLFRKNLRVPRQLDYLLRSMKYLLLFFFVWAVWGMSVPDLKAFIYSPYNRVADIKMYYFFAHISSVALWTLMILIMLSVVIKNFWCRYLCPYGALLGILSWLSPFKITRNKETCVDCVLCTKVCPANIQVHKAGRVWSDECMSCLKCVEICPVKETLEMKSSLSTKPISSLVFGSLVVGVFVAITGLAMVSGHWQNNVGKKEYLHHFQNLDSPLYQHNRGEVPQYNDQGFSE